MAHPFAVPPEVRDLADRRAAAREARDWSTADRLRGEIEAAGWKVVDSGTEYRLEPEHPGDVEVAGQVRYGRSDTVPSRFEEQPAGLATVIVVAREDVPGTRRGVAAVLRFSPADVDIVIVADGLSEAAVQPLRELLATEPPETVPSETEPRVELVRTSARLGQGAALNAGLRRARAAVVVVLDASVEPEADIVTPLVRALDDPRVAIVGPVGLRSGDLRRFAEVTEGPAAAIEGYAMAFRRADAIARGPIDEAFRFYRNLDVWWSLVLRDEGESRLPREARVASGLELRRHDHLAWTATPAAERDRLSKRNFYRILDRFRDRTDLAND